MARAAWMAAVFAGAVLLLFLCGSASAVERARHQLVDDVAISDISLLLPFGAKTKVSYELEAYNGCFKWESSHPEIVSVRPVYRTVSDLCGAQPGQHVGQAESTAGAAGIAAAAKNPFFDDATDDERCSTHAIVTVAQTNSKRAYSWIVAEDTISGRRVRCEVYVDTIKSIQIETTTRTMYHGDVEVLQVQALDGEGNLFSTLEGLQFKWSLVSLNANSASSALQFLRFVDSNVEVSDVLMEMEAQGKESHAVLVQGVESGKVNVAARLMELGTDVEQHVVTISVLEPLQLTPSHPVYVTPGTVIQYELQTYKNDYVRTVSMPNPQYVWLCGNASVATVDSAGLVEGLAFGESEVRVQYENMSENSASGEVHVVWPAYISIRVVPVEDAEKASSSPSNWYLISGRRYVISIDVFDVDNYKLYSTSNLDFQVDLGNLRHFTTVQVTENQSHHTVDALKEGLTQISATLSKVYNPRTKSYTTLEPPLTARQEIVIIRELSIEGGIKEVLLPADEACRSQPMQVRAVGGSGEHNWYSADPSVASVSAKGFVTPLAEGSTTIMAVDARNTLNRASVPVMVRKPVRIAITPLHREVQVGGELVLPISVFDKDGNAFSSCSCLPIRWTVIDEEKFTLSDSTVEAAGRGCAGIAVNALEEGQTSVAAAYGEISADILVFAFNPLTVSPDSSLVTLGSSAEVTGNGGPNPWYLEPGLFEAALYPERPNDVSVARANTHGNRYAFKVTCKAHGNQTLTLRVGNRASKSNEHPAYAERSVTFMCYPPTSIMLYPVTASDERKTPCVPSHSCGDSSWVFPTPSSVHSGNVAWPSHYSVRNDQHLHLRVAALGPDGIPYDDFSSLTIEWRSANTDIAKFPSGQACQSSEECVLDISKAECDALEVTASVVGYNRSRLQSQGVHTMPAMHNHQDLSKTVSFTILSSVVLHPAVVHIYAHEDNFVRLSTIGGSGIFEFQSNSTSIVALRSDESASGHVKAIPLQAGTAKITAVDRCLCSSRRAVSIVHVSEISSITLKIADMMPVGTELELEVVVSDMHGNKFDESQYPFMGLTSHVENEAILELVPISVSRFRVHGLSAGQGRISFSGVQGSGQVVSSPSKLIHVYPPFHLIPEKELVLLPSVSYQVDWEGGPPVGAKVSFSIENDRIATVDSIGVVTAKAIGETVLHSHVEAFDSVSGQRTRFGEDSIRIVVKMLDGIRILAPSSTVVVGTEMTLRVIGLDGENPFSFALNAVHFAWDTSNMEVASLAANYQLANISLPAEGMFSSRFVAKKLGQTRVTAYVIHGPDQLGMVGMSATAQISVVEELQLLTPARLLLSPFATFQVRTSLDGSVVYSTVCTGCGIDDTEPVCSVSASGLIAVGNRSGSSLVLVEHLETGQRLYVQVEVKPVDMVQLLVVDDREHSVHYSLPVGSSMALDAVFRDNLGRPFDQLEDTPLKFTTSNREVVAVGKVKITPAGRHQVLVDALQPGEALLQVAAQSRQTHGLVDFIHILVGNAIVPPSPTVHVGAVIEFSTSHKSTREPGYWRARNPSVLDVDATTGVARALKAGSTVFEHVGRVTTSTYVSVEQINDVRLDVSGLGLVSNFEREEEYWVPVSFFAVGGFELGPDADAVYNNVVYSCSVEPSMAASARADFYQDRRACVITLTPSSVTRHQAQPFCDALELKVVASDEAGTYQKTGKRSIPYYPAVTFVDAPPVVQLSSGKLFYRLQVKHGRSEPVLFSSDTSLLSVIRSTKHSDMSTFELGVVDPSEPFDEVVYLEVAVTGQKEAVRVVYSISEPVSGAIHPHREGSVVNSLAESSARRPASHVVQRVPEEELTAMHYLFVISVTLAAVVLVFLCCTETGAQLVTRPTSARPRPTPAPSTPSAVSAHSRVPAPTTPRTPLFSVPGSSSVASRFEAGSNGRGNMHQRLDFAASPMSPPTPFIQ